MGPQVGVDYPGSFADLSAWFPDDDACLDYLDWLRWRDGFVCPHCGDTRSWKVSRGGRACGGCRRRVSVTANTIFHRTRTPLTVWFAAAWLITSQKDGASALGVQRVLGLGSYGTAWSMLHRYRMAMVRPGRDKLSGDVEVDETYIGGPKPGARGRGAFGKVAVVVAVERTTSTRLGRCRLAVLPAITAQTLRAFLQENVEPGSVVITDGLLAYQKATAGLYTHKAINVKQSGAHAHHLLPGVHRIAALLKRWLMSTHQGAVRAEHLPAYLNEFCFRFNRRSASKRGLLFYRLMEHAVATAPTTNQALVAVASPGSRGSTAVPPTIKSSGPNTLAVPVLKRPWRGHRP